MAVVRELINRVGFRIDRGSLKNAENAFGKLQGSGVSAASLIGGGFKTLLGTLTTVTTAGLKLFSDFEKDVATVKFFSRSADEASRLLNAVEKIRGAESVSARERAQAAAEFSKLAGVSAESLGDVIPILERISVAQPELDFPDVVQRFVEFIRTGDISALESLGAIGKDLAETFRLSGLNLEQSVKGQRNRFQLLNSELVKSRDRINELAAEFEQTFTFDVTALTTQLSDFTLKFGETTAPAVSELLNSITGTLKELNESESLWESISETINDTSDFLKSAARIVTTTPEELEQRRVEALQNFQPRTAGEVIAIAKEVFGRAFIGPSLRDDQGAATRTLRAPITEVLPREININGEITLRGGNTIDQRAVPQTQNIIVQTIKERIIDPMRNQTAKNGGRTNIN